MFCAQFDTNLASTHGIIVNSTECLSIANIRTMKVMTHLKKHSTTLKITPVF